MKYIKRIVDEEINKKLRITGAILIRGPKWCGKTTSAKEVAKSEIEFQDPDMQDRYIELSNTKPSLLLDGDKPRLIDEWQIIPKIWNSVRHSCDKLGGLPGQYILTGSATPIEKDLEDLHTGTGRFSFIDMKPMTLFESGDSTGEISLKEILNGKRDIDGIKSNLTYEQIVYLICRGGWPSVKRMDKTDALEVSKSYIDTLCYSDISRIDGVKRDPILAKAILRAYARQVSTIDSDQSLFNDVKANHAEVSDQTIIDYINAFKRLFIIEDIPAWNPNIRSKTSIRKSPKKSIVDPSLATAILECSPDELKMDANTAGLLFENLVNRDLSVYAKSIGGTLGHYRDRYGLECDNVIHFENGKYALIETKLSGYYIKEAEEHLIKLRELILEKQPKLGAPEFMMVITGTDVAYSTENDILIVPIGCLKN